MFRSLILAAALLALHRLPRMRAKSPCCPSIKLQIGDRDDYGNYWDGGRWRDRDYWHNHYEWRKIAGGAMTTAIIAAGISVKRMNAVIGKAGAIATIIAGEAGVTNIITKPPAE